MNSTEKMTVELEAQQWNYVMAQMQDAMVRQVQSHNQITAELRGQLMRDDGSASEAAIHQLHPAG